MGAEKPRKTDRRTLYTRMVIRNALLSLLSEEAYPDITVAALCREAEINRGTFYLHYSNLREVLDELFDEVLGKMRSVLVQVGCAPADGQKQTYPLCRFLREHRQYRALFFSDALRGHMIERLEQSFWQDFSARLGARSGLNEEALKALFHFQLNGCLAISRQYIGSTDENWNTVQCAVDRFLKNGFDSLQTARQ